ncbi:hypothetical protein MANES_06G120401v8 [Manihot esculenta]|uniref:Uncharacterized protein n=1 Tax=Manihot esculenta TaxID=3983 RepID=A0ACB7HJK1_MANES|nr:hypothetical protein MANES_06G120401v8 [Manihot esculenta]
MLRVCQKLDLSLEETVSMFHLVTELARVLGHLMLLVGIYEEKRRLRGMRKLLKNYPLAFRLRKNLKIHAFYKSKCHLKRSVKHRQTWVFKKSIKVLAQALENKCHICEEPIRTKVDDFHRLLGHASRSPFLFVQNYKEYVVVYATKRQYGYNGRFRLEPKPLNLK